MENLEIEKKGNSSSAEDGVEICYQSRIKDWAVKHVTGIRAKFWLALLSFSEASFFPVQPDFLLIAILGVNAQRWFYYASLTTIFSLLGGIAGYLIGFFFFDLFGQQIIDFYNLHEEVRIVSEKFSNNAFWAIFFSALTPIPYKVFTISAGFFKINLIIFIIASIFGRAMRFFAVGYFMHKFGKQTVYYFFKYFNIISLLLILLIILLFVFV